MTPARQGPGRDIESTLAPLASEPVAPPDSAFTDALEQRLRTVHAVRVADGTDRPPAGARRWLAQGIPRRRAGWLAPLALAAAAVVGVFVVAGGNGGPQPTGPTIQVAQAVDAEVIAPDGQATRLHPGAQLPEGTVVRTGPVGQLSADGRVLGPDSEAVVHGGHLTVLVPGHPAPAGRPGHARPSPAPAPHGAPSHQSETPTTAAPTPASRPAPAGGSTGPAGGHDHGAVPAGSGSSSIQLSAHHGQGHTQQLTWSAYDGPNLYGYVVLRSIPPNTPSYPRDAVHFIPASGPLAYTDDAGSNVEYQIVAIDSSGGVLASSNIEH